MTRIKPPPYLIPELLKVMPSIAPTHLSELSDPPHLFNLIRRHGRGVTGRHVAQRRRLVQTGIADLFYQITHVDTVNELPTAVRANVLYKGYPVYKKSRYLPAWYMLDHTWDFVSGRGRMLKGSDFEREREHAVKEPGVLEMLKELAPAKNIVRDQPRPPVIKKKGAPKPFGDVFQGKLC